ncbi:type I polyketide synthase [Limnoraphis robusta]|uniref:SDR family NAD(P)-dependent oxidoreductase n=1 Tax=Limnoraphis robusta CCNP1315 TaxID=3110306 RepID=A0ABU5TSQ3_9CYAN|nr:SDR family NAD(P)-dependent oxidoreductase [Limnoraphis robusta]MEA5517930.1 SDR family NAD(P)-dependent oxidoreductase [Limnoraphis robusta CCNP1315]MEA5543729.1 SDR family NAD(P)-dependent oxidoreductase [Limnoraphis robusta CCNP1324]
MENLKMATEYNGLEIAIIGMAGRFPEAQNLEQFWDNLKNGVESIHFYQDKELLELGIDEDLIHHPQYVKAGGKLEGIDLFDAEFFGFNPKEAELLDPQHRLFLECAWEALENAGYDSEKYSGTIGVYGGAGMNGYLFNLYTNPKIINSVSNYQLFLASDKDFLTTRVSYKLNLSGPSVDIQTACSTSLVAVHLACQSLLSGDCDIALAGGVAISKQVGYLYQEEGIYSPDGHCRTFDDQAQGTIGGNGVGIVVLKRLEDAITSGDSIQAIIKGSAINNDGAFKVSYTAPRIDTQAQVIQAAQIMAEVEPETISYIEAHGTGTALGDPIEISALTQAFRAGTEKKNFCAIASVKPNVGHLDAAAGVAGLIKTILALKHQQIPPLVHFKKPNKQINFEDSPFYVNTSLSNWKTNNYPRRAGVSSFGIGGTNAHVILEEALTVQPSSPSRPWQLLLISAKTNTALETATNNLVTYLKQHSDLNLADIAYTLKVGRRAFNYRRMMVCQTLEESIKTLESLEPDQVFTQFQEPSHHSVIFMFPGQGTQYINMGLELYKTEKKFREIVDYCCETLKAYLNLDLRDILYPKNSRSDDKINETLYTQPALFVVEYALAKLLIDWGIHPEAMIGHSVGEYVAACLAGIFSLENALFLMANRGKLMQQQPYGAMISVTLSIEDVQPLLSSEIAIAANNAPKLSVLSGSIAAIERLQEQLEKQGIPYKKLHTSHAFHSPMMDSAQTEFLEIVEKVSLNNPQIPFISNLTGTWITAEQATDPKYWAKHLRQTVLFSSGIAELIQDKSRIFLEVGPGRTLSSLTKQQSDFKEQIVLSSIRHPQHNQSDIAFLLTTLGKLWLAGININLSKFYTSENRLRLPLPTYPFERKKYWVEPSSEPLKQPNKKRDLADWFYVPTWERMLLPEPMDLNCLSQLKKSWLIFLDSLGVGTEIAQTLMNAGQDVITVSIGETFDEVGYRMFEINPQQKQDYQALIEDLNLREFHPDYIVHLWGIEDSKQTSHLRFEDPQHYGFYSLLFLTQSLANNKGYSTQIFAVTNPIFNVMGSEEVYPEKATILGLCLGIAQEHPQLSCRHLDVRVPASKKEQKKLSDRLLSEFLDEPTELTIAYRDSYRWKRIFKPIKIDAIQEKKIQLRQSGVYLIVGDFDSGIGLILAKYFAETVAAKLILVSSEKLPDCSEIKRLSSDCLTFQIDLTNESEMKAIVDKIDEQFGQLHGVIYSTPMSNENSIDLLQQIKAEKCNFSFKEKVQKLYVLEKVLQNKKPDFYILQSSLSSIVGGIGLAAYSAANQVIDAFANYKNNQNLVNKIPTLWYSINWDAITSQTPQQTVTGLAANLAEFTIKPDEVWKVCQQILSLHSPTQVIVSKGDLDTRINQWVKVKPLSEKIDNSDPTQPQSSTSGHSRPNLSQEYVAPRDKIEQTIAIILQELLGIEKLGVNDNFFDLGGHSLLAIQAISRLRETFQVELPLRSLLFETPTVAGMAAVIAQNKPQPDEWQEMAELLAEVKRLSPDEVQQRLDIDE